MADMHMQQAGTSKIFVHALRTVLLRMDWGEGGGLLREDVPLLLGVRRLGEFMRLCGVELPARGVASDDPSTLSAGDGGKSMRRPLPVRPPREPPSSGGGFCFSADLALRGGAGINHDAPPLSRLTGSFGRSSAMCFFNRPFCII